MVKQTQRDKKKQDHFNDSLIDTKKYVAAAFTINEKPNKSEEFR